MGTLLYIAGDRPDLQFHVKELAGKLQKPTVGAMTTLKQVIRYLVGTADVHAKMTGRDPARTFQRPSLWSEHRPTIPKLHLHRGRSRWQQTLTGTGTNRPELPLLVDQSFISGNWIYSYSRTQKCVTLSSTEAEYIALVSGSREGLLGEGRAGTLDGRKGGPQGVL